ncbi:ABC transporter substrate-binding protein [Streptomyces sp. 549]|uniref:ABC transporter family substrate-binding protein n=1 Tax=Streptomyces sp. 549 TaxID=3049076 RepID=UPI0024C39D3B|nr:ABC transporter family substrate-binding protein [Streptomyces sp. 549]MDK1476739.1 ABC transporter substrate-binding protein [Streptomyces sp. 549]
MPAIDTAARRCAAVLAAGILLPPVLAGCGAGTPADEGKGGAARDVPAVSRDRISDGGSLRWAVESLPTTLNTFQSDANAATDRVADATLPRMFTLDGRAEPQLNTDVLRSAEVVAREPQQTVVYTLNPKARWSDGRRIDAVDFQAQWKALGGSDNAYWTARNAGYERIHKVEKGDGDDQVKVTFARRYSDWKSLFTPLYPRSVTGRPKAFNDDSRTAMPVSGGPFQVKGGKLDRAARTVVLERNPRWWGARAKLDEIRLVPVARTARGKALAAGRLDFAEIEQSAVRSVTAAAAPPQTGTGRDTDPAGARDDDGKNGSGRSGTHRVLAPLGSAPHAAEALRAWAHRHRSEKEDAKARAEGEKREAARQKAAEQQANLRALTVRRAYDPAWTQLALNGTSGPLRDERVRRAVARAVDRAELAEAVLRPAGLPGRPLGSHLRMYDQDGYHDHSGALGDAGAESASALLAEAGWKGGPIAGTRRADGAGDGGGTEGDGGTGPDADDGGSPYAVTAPVFTGLTHSAAAAHAALLRQAAYADEAAAESAAEDGAKGAAKRRAAAKESMRKAKEADAALSRFVGGLLRAEGSLVRAKEGRELELSMVLPAGKGSAQLRDTGRQVARMLEGVGVRTRITEVRDESFFKDHVASGDFDLALFSWPATAYPVTDARPIFAKPEVLADGSLLIEQNYTRVGTDQIDRLFEQAANELDEGRKRDLVKRIDARVWAVAGSVPLYQRPQLVAVNSRLGNIGAFGFQTPRYQDIGYLRGGAQA